MIGPGHNSGVDDFVNGIGMSIQVQYAKQQIDVAIAIDSPVRLKSRV